MNERHIVICADDYGISPAVNAAIRDLIVRERINATSVIVAAPSFSRAEAQALLAAAGSRAAIGLHVTLTAPFRPLSQNFAPLRNGAKFCDSGRNGAVDRKSTRLNSSH